MPVDLNAVAYEFVADEMRVDEHLPGVPKRNLTHGDLARLPKWVLASINAHKAYRPVEQSKVRKLPGPSEAKTEE